MYVTPPTKFQLAAEFPDFFLLCADQGQYVGVRKWDKQLQCSTRRRVVRTHFSVRTTARLRLPRQSHSEISARRRPQWMSLCD
jgi:hypothetical protein